jgi:putative ABC transport system permease protein
MRYRNILMLAVRSISRNKTRSFLTMLGIIIGVAAVIAMLAVGQGARDAINAQIESMGTNVIMVSPGAHNQGGVHMEAGTSSQLTEEDVTAIKSQCPSVQFVTPMVRTSAQIKFENQNWRTQIYGVYASYLDIRSWQLQSGTVFSDGDERGATKVCIVGQTIVDNLFSGEDPIGKIIRIGKLPFKIVGVLSVKGQSSFGQDQDDIIMAPFSTVQKKIMGTTYVSSINASAVSEKSVESGRQEIDQALSNKRKGSGGDGASYTIRTQTDISNMANQTSQTLSILLASIAAVSLVVGGIGIMNIMLVSVTERTREIGIRMAVGAKGNDVLLQFLVESLMLSVCGGIIGIILGTGFSSLISSFQGWAVRVSPFAVFLGFGFSAAIGMFFGWYPARKAANLNPIDALRYE